MIQPISTDGYVRFLELAGHRVVSCGQMRWYDAGGRFFMAAPPHRRYEPTEEEIQGAFHGLQCVGVRFAAPLSGPGKLSYQLTCDNADYGLEALSSNTRSKVRRGLRRCRIEPVDLDVLREAGKRAHQDTVGRQGREGALAGERWDRFFRAAAASPGFEGWGAWVEDDLAAFLVTVTFDDGVEFLLARSGNDTLGAYPNNALIFTLTEEMLVRRRVAQITFGLESLEPVGPLDQFKFSMGYDARPLRQRIVFHPLLRSVLRHDRVRRLAQGWAHRRGEETVFWRKAEGILRFADEGGF